MQKNSMSAQKVVLLWLNLILESPVSLCSFILNFKENTEVFSFCDKFDKKHSNLVLECIV